MNTDIMDDTYLVRRYVCARCWSGLLIVKRKDEPEHIECGNHANCDGKGYVTKRYADRRRVESVAELAEVKKNYPELFTPKVKKTEKEILAMMGY